MPTNMKFASESETDDNTQFVTFDTDSKEPAMKASDITDRSKTSMKALVAFYNSKADKPVKKFADRKSAESRCLELVAAKAPAAKKAKAPAAKKAPAKKAGGASRDGSKRGNKPGTVITRHRVKVNGIEYRSTKQAFEELDLPLGVHIAFRMELKEAGRKVFAGEDGSRYTFTLLEVE